MTEKPLPMIKKTAQTLTRDVDWAPAASCTSDGKPLQPQKSEIAGKSLVPLKQCEERLRKHLKSRKKDICEVIYCGPHMSPSHNANLPNSIKTPFLHKYDNLCEDLFSSESKLSGNHLSDTFDEVLDCACVIYSDKVERSALEFAEQRIAHELCMSTYDSRSKLSTPLADQIFNKVELLNKGGEADVVYSCYTGARLIVLVASKVGERCSINMFYSCTHDDQFDGNSLKDFLNIPLHWNPSDQYTLFEYKDLSDGLIQLFKKFGHPLITVLEKIRGPRSVYDIIHIPDACTAKIPLLSIPYHCDRNRSLCLGDRLRIRHVPCLHNMDALGFHKSLESCQKFCIIVNPTNPNSCSLFSISDAICGVPQEMLDQQPVRLLLTDVAKQSVSSEPVDIAPYGTEMLTDLVSTSTKLIHPVFSIGAQTFLMSTSHSDKGSEVTFIKFFYQYLMDGFRSSVALHKASLSLRCFAKYSHYVHWSGYQLTGREIQLNVHMSSKDKAVLSKVGVTPTFPRLKKVRKLEAAFLKDAATLKDQTTPTDVQLVHGFHGLKPSEPVIDFVKKHHTHFTGGVFFVCGAAPEFIQAAEVKIKQALSGVFPLQPPLKSTPHILLIFDNLSSLPPSEFLQELMMNTNTHIIVTLNSTEIPKDFTKSINHEILRGTNTINLKPLSSLHSTQRLVHAIMKSCDTDNFIAYIEEQKMLSLIVGRMHGSPDIIDITSTVCAKQLSQANTKSRREILGEFYDDISDENETRDPSFVLKNVLGCMELSQSDHFLLTSLHWFGPIPIPRELIDILQSMITSANKVHTPSSKTPLDNLLSLKLLQVYPSTVIVEPTSSAQSFTSTPPSSSSDSDASSLTYVRDADFYYVPQLVADALKHDLDSELESKGRDLSLMALSKALQQFREEIHYRTHATGLTNVFKRYNELNT